MANKKLDFTPQQLKAVHEVLHNQSFGRVLQDLASDLDTSATRRTDNSRINLDPLQQKLVQLLQKLDQTVTDSHKSQAIKELIRDLQQGGNPGRIANALTEQFAEEIKANPALARQIMDLLNDANSAAKATSR